MAFHAIEVFELEEEESLEMLEKYSGVTLGPTERGIRTTPSLQSNTQPDTKIPTAREDALDLLRTLGHFPLAIAQVDAYRQTGKLADPIRFYLDIYRRNAAATLRQKPASSA